MPDHFWCRNGATTTALLFLLQAVHNFQRAGECGAEECEDADACDDAHECGEQEECEQDYEQDQCVVDECGEQEECEQEQYSSRRSRTSKRSVCRGIMGRAVQAVTKSVVSSIFEECAEEY